MDQILTGDSIGLLVAKFALLGDEDALEVVEWMTEKLYPESLASDRADMLSSRMQIYGYWKINDIWKFFE